MMDETKINLDHLFWADNRVLNLLKELHTQIPKAVREFAHILGAEEIWLSRLEQRSSRLPVWPEMSFSEIESFSTRIHEDYRNYLEGLNPEALNDSMSYKQTTGASYTQRVVDILQHVCMHGQYHRGKINWIVREAGFEPVPLDYIVFLRSL